MKSKQANSRQALQIIAGEYRSRQITFIEADGLRPTGARIRETLFNWLTPIIYGKNCLDLFAGSGILGFEALSRGAKSVTFVEKNHLVAQQIQQNIQLLQVKNAKLVNVDYQKMINSHFDVVFLDPPYQLNLLPELMAKINDVRPQYIFVEDDKSIEHLGQFNDNYQLVKSKKAGSIYYGLFSLADA